MRATTLKRLCPAAVLAAALLAAHGGALAGGLDSLAQFIAQARSGQAAFTQTVTPPPKDGKPARAKTQSGDFAFERPGKFRFDYRQPFEQTIVADGATLWFYDADLNQATSRAQAQALAASPAAIVAAATDLAALRKDFDLTEEADADGQQWVRAVPKSRDGQLQAIRIGFKPASGAGQGGGAPPALATLEILDSFGQQSVLRFEGLALNARLPAGRFKFTPPEGAQLVRQ